MKISFKRFNNLRLIYLFILIVALLIGCDSSRNADIKDGGQAPAGNIISDQEISDNIETLFGTSYSREDEIWTVTQYGDSTNKQNSFYLIVSNKGKVIAIDGGWRDNGSLVASEINKLGGHVDAWILTHPHPDHIGAFNEVYKLSDNYGNADGIKIDAIYDNNLDYDYYDSVDEEWDEIDVYKEYLELISTDTSVHHVSVGDKISVGSLSISFFNAYNENVQSVVTDIGNNASLVFAVDTTEKSMLFVGDCYSEAIINHVFATYGNDINVSMAQMPHHGNSTLPDSYYESLDLSICFFDAPAWLVEGEGYTTRSHMDAMESDGAFCYDQSTAPNTVALYE